ncbi:MAG: HAMP domain-containing histidine kinase, partial [Thermoproteota archaeon]|nr:HAMP domain-containing histidine kinase [Thermoproteota archaeon]
MSVPTTPADAAERTEVLYGTENVINKELQFFSRAKNRIDTCMDHTRPSLAIGIESIKRSFLDAKSRDVRLRYLTEITNSNISYCKELMSIVNELHHLDGIKGNFMISETEYLAPATSHEETKPASLIIFSSLKEIVEHQQYVFETLWNKSISAEKRIRELEQGITMHYETKIIEDPDEVVKEIARLTANSNVLLTCITSGGMQYSYNHFFEIKKILLEKEKKGEHKGIRYVSSISTDNAKLARVFLDAGIQIRHVKNLPPMSFGVSDKEIAATIEKMEGGRMVQSLLLSNEPAYINHFYSIFQELWNKGIDAEDMISNIQEGTDLADIEIIRNPREGLERAWNYVKKSKHEVLAIFSTANAFRRQMQLGLLQLLKEATEARGVQVRILIPADKRIKDTIEQAAKICPQVDFRIAEENLQTRITIVLIDKKDSMIIELQDDTKDSSYYAAGLTTYSNSKSIISSYASIFESLWKQNELYEQLKIHDKMQHEFINVAAHELRTPIQPIIGLTEMLRSQIKDIKQLELLEVTIRNAKRLMQLTNDILDVTKIEGKSLDLKKQEFNLNDVVINSMNDITLGRDFLKNENISLSYKPQDILIQADKGRITQVISNLLSNAVKFIKEAGLGGTVIVDIEKKRVRRTGQENKEYDAVVVSIKDDGPGIDPEIMPRLFTKFAAKSDIGTGLGLFISKNIVEAHGG